MTTQNINFAPAESTETWGKESTYIRTDGFVKDVNSSHPHDVIRADAVISRLMTKADQGCGLRYEIYQYHLIESAMAYLNRLPKKDCPVFLLAAEKQGLALTAEALERSANAYCDLRNELFEED